VRLVHRHQRHVQVAQHGPEAGEDQALRRDVDQREGPRGEPGHASAHLADVERGGQVGRGHPARLEGLDLVGHQRDQG
jgi:hypothetical protein